MNIKLFHNSKTGDHHKLLSDLILSSEESVLCSGWIKPDGIRALAPAIESAISKRAKITILSNKNHTKGDAPEIIAQWPEVTHVMARKKHQTLHSKIYYFQTGNEYTAIIGSANLTKGGLSTSQELSVHLHGKVGEDLQKEIREYLNELQNQIQT
jgi:HKD family nuclease